MARDKMKVNRLSYGLYLDLLNGIDEHTGCRYSKCQIQTWIFEHYTDGAKLVASNGAGETALFCTKIHMDKFNREELRRFRKFMNFDG